MIIGIAGKVLPRGGVRNLLTGLHCGPEGLFVRVRRVGRSASFRCAPGRVAGLACMAALAGFWAAQGQFHGW